MHAQPLSSLALVSLLLCLIIGSVACTTPRQLGDRALAEKKYQEALDYYDEEIESGSRDPELFYNAAQASLNQGDFGAAERYYSRSLRYGGGVKVMRSLAKLYIQTSNYARAAQVLYELLRIDPDQQTIYTNLGTALLYGGQYPKAESILLVAQQLDPGDPLPYLNLAVLYDRHLVSPARSAAFYSCYVELSPEQAPNRALARARSQELLLLVASRSGYAFPLECGVAYVPGDVISEEERQARLQELKAEALKEEALILEEQQGDAPKSDNSTPSKKTTRVDLNLGSSPEEPNNSPTLSVEEREATLRTAYKSQNCQEVVKLAPSSVMDELSMLALRQAADCHVRLDDAQHAEIILLSLLKREPSSGDLLSLFELMKDGREDEIQSLCKEYSDLLTLTALRQRCEATAP